MSQKQIFLQGEGDKWFERNLISQNLNSNIEDPVLHIIKELNLDYSSVLEVGCSNGYRLNYLKKNGAKLYGIDPSKKAIDNGLKNFENLLLSQGTADQLNFEDDKFDLLIFGFCLYLVDKDDLFKVSSEANRVLKNNGTIIIYDFEPTKEYFKEYHHKKDVLTHKMDYSKMFTWSQNYFLRYKQIFNHNKHITDIHEEDSRVSINILLKTNDINRK